jgi:hypothetical protein
MLMKWVIKEMTKCMLLGLGKITDLCRS